MATWAGPTHYAAHPDILSAFPKRPPVARLNTTRIRQYYPSINGPLDDGVDSFKVLAGATESVDGKAWQDWGHRVWGGVRNQAVIEDLYYRIHLIPSRIDYGNLLSNQSTPVIVWNAYFSDTEITAINGSGTTGLELDEPFPAPFTMPPLTTNQYVQTATTTGPITINAEYDIVTDKETVKLIVTGTRVVIIASPPNWDEGLKETLEWKTRVIIARDGSESRASLVKKPRRVIDFTTVTYDPVRTQSMNNTLWSFQGRNVAVPVWQDCSKLKAEVNPSDVTVTVETETYSFYVGGLLMLYKDFQTFEVIAIASIAGDQVTLENGVEGYWPVGTQVFPVNTGRVPSSIAKQRTTDHMNILNLGLIAEPLTTDPNTPVKAAPLTHDGLELWTKKPNWGRSLGEVSTNDYVTVDLGYGPMYHYLHNVDAVLEFTFPYYFEDRQSIQEYREFLARRYGQRVPFWMPSWGSDLTLHDDAFSGESGIQIKDERFADFVGLTAKKGGILIELRDGTLIPKTLNGVTKEATIENVTGLTFTTPLSQHVLLSNVARISIMYRFRMTTDRPELEWITAEQVESVLPVKAVAE